MGLAIGIEFNGLSYHHSIDEHPDSREFYLHCHNFYEIYYFLCGEGTFTIEGNRYELKKNTLLLLRPSEFHYFKIENPVPYERCVLHFNADELMNCFSDRMLFTPFLDRALGKNNLLTPDPEDEMENFFVRIDQCALLPAEERKLKTQFILGELLCTILNISKRDGIPVVVNNSNALAESIIHYINKNITSPVILDELAAEFFVSKYYLSHIFKKFTGVSLLEYALRKKILLASQMIKNGTKASKAAQHFGFGDYSSFYRSYKRILKTSPGRKK